VKALAEIDAPSEALVDACMGYVCAQAFHPANRRSRRGSRFRDPGERGILKNYAANFRLTALDNHLPHCLVVPQTKLRFAPGLQPGIFLHAGMVPAQQLLGSPIIAPGIQILQQR